MLQAEIRTEEKTFSPCFPVAEVALHNKTHPHDLIIRSIIEEVPPPLFICLELRAEVTMNATKSPWKEIEPIQHYYIPCSLSAGFGLIAVLICLFILFLVRRTKSRLHTVNHLLICNTCLASMFYCVVININYVYLIFIPSETSDISCRLRAYFAYTSIAAVIYSYFIQAISRFCFSVLSLKYRWLITFPAHYLLILVQWSVVFLLTLPAIVTKDINFLPNALCWVGLHSTLHLLYTVVAYYLIPVLLIIIIYTYIYYRVRQANKNTTITSRTSKRQKLDLELLRNILILLSIYLGGGLPLVIYILTSIRTVYMVNLVTMSSVVALEKLFTMMLDREIRSVIRHLIARQTLVMPFETTMQQTRH